MSAVWGVIMAGGRGSRMKASGVELPKPLVEVGGVPLLLRNVRAMLRARIRRLMVAVNAFEPQLAEFVNGRAREEAARVGGEIECFVEREALGTIGAAGELSGRAELVVVTNADLYAAIDLGALARAHRTRGADLTISTHVETYRLELGEVIHDSDGRVTNYLEKPEKRSVISSGTYVLGPRALALLERGRRADAPEVVRRAIAAGLSVLAAEHDSLFIDVNDAARVRSAEASGGEDSAPIATQVAVLIVEGDARSIEVVIEPGETPEEAVRRSGVIFDAESIRAEGVESATDDRGRSVERHLVRARRA